jgi:hypothetical protein
MTHSTCLPPQRGTSYCGVTRFSRDARMARVCQDSWVHRLHARSPIAHSKVPIIASLKELRPWRSVSRHTSSIYQEGAGTSVTSTFLQNYITRHYKSPLVQKVHYMLSIGKTYCAWVRRYSNLARGHMHIVMLVLPGTYMYVKSI